ncbi:3-keto-5-aminohexanoate cleavage protein [Halorarius litoreus]|uniref:3-keto-5-aminohexanoate cleavage protein n=1 Tax=Halorarius litoreus TaxID=2962676 RepID=UPI0020CBB66B|nr:3-keto-5-aminohexanoate cleavage protein [Halorarius litoreus]
MPYEGFDDYFEKKMILSVATTGGLHGKEANPNLPTQPEEVATDLAACEEAGASMVHLHARDANHEDTKDVERFQQLLDAIDDHCDDIVVNFTTGGGGIYSREERIAPVLETEPGPEVATIDVGPMNFGQTRTAINPREMSEEYAERMREAGVKPELELFNQGHIPEMQNLIDKGLVDAPYWATVILGMQTGTPPHPRNLINFVDNLPEDTEWQALAVGRYQLPLTTMAITMGGHVRVGMEDNVYYRKGELAESNAQLVRRTARIADELDRPLATPDETREILGL